MVGHGDDDVVPLGGDEERHRLVSRRVLQGVRQEVGDDLVQAERIGLDRGGRLRGDGESDAIAAGLIADRRFEERHEEHRLGGHDDPARLEPSEDEQVVDEAGEPIGLGRDHLEELIDLLVVHRVRAGDGACRRSRGSPRAACASHDS